MTIGSVSARGVLAGLRSIAALVLPLAGPATAQDGPDVPLVYSALDKVKLYGDLRLRHESDIRTEGRADRHRERVRMRLGVNYQATDELLLGTRVVTGDPDDPRSTHVTLGDGLNDLDVSFDRIFLSYRPGALPGAFLTAGKFDHPFVRNPVYGELVWDADAQPEGIVAGHATAAAPLDEIRFVAGWYALLERGEGSDAHAWVCQASARARPAESTQAFFALGYYGYSDVTPGGASALLENNAGNATVDGDGDGVADDFLSRFGILDAIAAFTWRGPWKPVTVSGELVENLRARTDRERGFALGLALGEPGRRGDWRVSYQWQVLEEDSVFSPFAQDDFLRTTDHRSHLAGVEFQVTDDVGLHLWAIASEPDAGEEENEWRIRLDLDVKL